MEKAMKMRVMKVIKKDHRLSDDWLCRVDMTLLIFLLKDVIIYRIRPGKHKKQGMWYFMIVYSYPKIIENTSILCLN